MARRKKITVETDNSNWKAPKVRKKRKPMTENQRAAAATRCSSDIGLRGLRFLGACQLLLSVSTVIFFLRAILKSCFFFTFLMFL